MRTTRRATAPTNLPRGRKDQTHHEKRPGGDGRDAGEEALIAFFVAFQALRARRRAGEAAGLGIANLKSVAEDAVVARRDPGHALGGHWVALLAPVTGIAIVTNHGDAENAHAFIGVTQLLAVARVRIVAMFVNEARGRDTLPIRFVAIIILLRVLRRRARARRQSKAALPGGEVTPFLSVAELEIAAMGIQSATAWLSIGATAAGQKQRPRVRLLAAIEVDVVG
jgi:hypothetical protein